MTGESAPPRVTVIIPNFNGKLFLEQALLGLRRQTYHDSETIVVDNASTDGSLELIKGSFPEVTLIALEENAGFARANNIAIQRARGEFVALLNNDAIPEPIWLEELVSAADRRPEASFFASRVELYFEPGLLDSAGDGISTACTVFRRGHRSPVNAYSKEEYVFGAQGCAAFYRRALFDRIGFFDEDFFCVYEDADLSYRAQLCGLKCLYVPQARVRHRGGSTIGRFSREYVYQSHRNAEYILMKDVPAPLLWRMFPAHLLYVLMAFVFFTFKGQGSAFLRAKWDALRASRHLISTRRQIQASRQVPIEHLRRQLDQNWIPRVLREKARNLWK